MYAVKQKHLRRQMGRRLSWYHPYSEKLNAPPSMSITLNCAPVSRRCSGEAPALMMKTFTSRLLSAIIFQQSIPSPLYIFIISAKNTNVNSFFQKAAHISKPKTCSGAKAVTDAFGVRNPAEQLTVQPVLSL